MELLFQVLLQFGDSRKVVEITEQSKDEVISKVKRLFDINTCNELLLQEYEDEWQEWVDVEDVHRIKDKAKLRVLVQRDQVAFKEKHAVSFFYVKLIYSNSWNIFISRLLSGPDSNEVSVVAFLY